MASSFLVNPAQENSASGLDPNRSDMRAWTLRRLSEVTFFASAQEYVRSLPPEQFMESIFQATQRAITVSSLALVHQYRPEVQVFNDLLVQYRPRRFAEISKVVPDNMVVIHDQPINVEGSYDLPLQPDPLWVIDYLSKCHPRKTYSDDFSLYENDLKVPYYLLCCLDGSETLLLQRKESRYVTVLPNAQNRLEIPELELEIALHEGWTRYWFRGELLLLPEEMLRKFKESERRADEARSRADQLRESRLALEQELERLRTERKEK